MEKIFETAVREKIRFNYKGTITTEDLWDLDSKALDSIYKGLMSEKKESETESLLSETKSDATLECKIAVVKHIFNTKKEEAEAAEKRMENYAKKQKILAIIARKQDAELEGKSAEELEALLADL